MTKMARTLRTFVRYMPKPIERIAHSLYDRVRRRLGETFQVSGGHRQIPASEVTQRLATGWKDPSIPTKQRPLVQSELSQMYDGDIPRVYQAAADAVRATGMLNGRIIEIGCASGYYYEVLRHLLRQDVHYIGIDYSPSLIAQARQVYPHVPFLIADATRLPLVENGCDIILSGGVLLHVPRYDVAIRESARTAKHWCIFHRVPVKPSAPTVFFSKRAYGVEVVELVFQEGELLGLFRAAGLTLAREFTVVAGRLEGIAEDVLTKTYVCRK